MTDPGGNGKDEHGDPYGGCSPDMLDTSRLAVKMSVLEKDVVAMIAHCRECRTDSREHDGLMSAELVHISKEQVRMADEQRAMLSRLDEIALNVEMIATFLKGKTP